MLWKSSACAPGHKIRLWNAVIRAKVLYGLESLHMTPAVLRRLDTFHLRGLRQILRITTTFIDRSHTNEYVYARAAEAVAASSTAPSGDNAVRPLSELHSRARVALLGHLLRVGCADPLRSCAFQSEAAPVLPLRKRPGRPKQNWVLESMQKAWPQVQAAFEQKATPLEWTNVLHQEHLFHAATMAYIYKDGRPPPSRAFPKGRHACGP